MTQQRCWFCNRTEEELKAALPEEFWDENSFNYFESFEVMGKFVDVREASQGEYPGTIKNDEMFMITQSPWFFDSDEIKNPPKIWAIGKKAEIAICRICLNLVSQIGHQVVPNFTGSAGTAPTLKDRYSYRWLYSSKKFKQLVKQGIEQIKHDHAKIQEKYPVDVYQVLLAIDKLNPDYAAPLGEIAKQWSPGHSFYRKDEKEKELRAIILSLLQQHPEIGKYDKNTQTLVFTSPQNKNALKDLLHEYQENLKRIGALK